MTFWHRLIGAALLFGLVSLLAQFVDWWLAHRDVAARGGDAATGCSGAGSPPSILVVGLFSALLVIPGVRAVAGGLLASSAVLAVSSASPRSAASETSSRGC